MTSHSTQPQHLTRMFARVVGPYLIAIASAAALRPSEMKKMLWIYEGNPLWPWVTGAVILLLGLITVALHSCWHGSAAVIISLIGWLIVAEGVILVAYPNGYFEIANAAIGAVGWWQGGAVVYAIVGLYLTYVGWVPQQGSSATEVTSAVEIRRAA